MMTPNRLSGWICCSVLLLTACAISEGPLQKLNRATFDFNEGLRWGRYNDVLPVVDTAAMEHFMEMHEGWGKSIRISAVDILQTTYDDKQKKAILRVQFSWYRANEMIAYETTTLQNWEYRDGRWWMMAEAYDSGDPF